MTKIVSTSGTVIGNTSGVNDGEALVYDASTSQWVPGLVSKPEVVGPKVLLSYLGHGFGRFHEYNGQLFTVGSHNTKRPFAWSVGETTYQSLPRGCVDRPANGFKKLITGQSYLHALGNNGVLYSMGADDLGQLGNRNSPNAGTIYDDSKSFFLPNYDPLIYGPGIEVLDIWSHEKTARESTDLSGALWVSVNDNGVYKLYAAGFNVSGVLGIGGSTNQGGMSQGTRLSILDGNQCLKVSCHTDAALFLMADGTVWGAGWNQGNLGITFQGASSLAKSMLDGDVSITDAVDAISVWILGLGICSFVLRGDGTVISSGYNYNGGLGRSGNSTRFLPVYRGPGDPIDDIVSIQAAVGMCFMLDSAGNVWATGRNHDGVFGDGSTAYSTTNVYARIIQTDIEKFWILGGNRAGWVSAVWKKKDGTVWGSGSNADYQLGMANHDTNIQTEINPIDFPYGEVLANVISCGGTNDYNIAYFAFIYHMENDNLYGAGRTWMTGHVGIGQYAFTPKIINDFR